MTKNLIYCFLTLYIFTSCKDSKQINEPYILLETQQPFVSLDSLYELNKSIHLFITDSLVFFNPTTNGQSIAVICEQINLKDKDFDFIHLHINMPKRQDGNIEVSFSSNDFFEMRKLYFNDSLKTFYNQLIKLNWESRNDYSDNYMTLIDRVNMTFQEEIRKNYSSIFPGGSDWYGYNSFIIFNSYYKNSKSIDNIIKSLRKKPNSYLKKDDIDKLMILIEEEIKT